MASSPLIDGPHVIRRKPDEKLLELSPAQVQDVAAEIDRIALSLLVAQAKSDGYDIGEVAKRCGHGASWATKFNNGTSKHSKGFSEFALAMGYSPDEFWSDAYDLVSMKMARAMKGRVTIRVVNEEE